MRRPPPSALLVAAALILLGTFALQWCRPRAPRPTPSAASSTAPAPSAAPIPASTAAPNSPNLPRSPLADSLGAPTTLPADEPRLVLTVLEAYRRQLGAYPTGEDNRALLRALTGANPSRLAFVPPDHPRLNARGELLDAWATPFFFHLLARDRIEIRSAGPDRQFYTPDDLLAASHPAPPFAPVAPSTPGRTGP